jgi:Ca2+-binding RTX toxin-like protein
VIQGDGSVESRLAGAPVYAYRDADNELQLNPSFEADTDGDDYIEGGGGSDVVFAGLGQDDVVGGSSSLFGLDTAEQRPDGADILFGGAGTLIDRNDERLPVATSPANAHARDADAIAGDNANVVRIVGTSGADQVAVFFNYDNYGSLPIVVRGIELLDYTPGGMDFAAAAAALDLGAADELHGESGDDVIYGMVGADVLFGESHDDDVLGGYGHDWISAGTGDDGVLGDDGRISTSRNGLPEPLYGLAAEAQRTISTPGNHHVAVLFPTGRLNKTVNLTPFNVDGNLAGQDPLYDPADADDILYGGLGHDFVHGGAGDDAISGAEALALFYDRPQNPGDVLGFARFRADEFMAYDEFDPMRRIEGFLLNFDAHDAGAPLVAAGIQSDGDDMLFGDLGNDWVVGGTGRDWLFGGFGADLLNVDDDQDTNGGANDQPDGPQHFYEDYAFGGAGRDVMIANTGGDRLVDWAGEFNSYLVPFSPFGMSTITRAGNPTMQNFLEDLGYAAGADRTRAADTGADPARRGEPEGELGLVNHSDPWWQDQTGAPDDPQPGNTNGRKDILRFADFNNGTASGFSPDSGTWEVSGGVLQVSASSVGGDAVSVFHVGEQLPMYYELQATIKTMKPTGGWRANSFVVFDYHSPTDFKFAGLDVSIDKIQLGHRDATGWHVDAQLSNVKLRSDTYYNLLVAVNGLAVTVTVDNKQSFSYAYEPRIIDGLPSNLNWGDVGFGSNNARGQLDNIQVKVLERPFTLQTTEDFSDGAADRFTGYESGGWQVVGGRYEGVSAGSDPALSLVDLGLEKGIESNARLELSARLKTGAPAGFVFDFYAADDFKFVTLDAAAGRIVVGHRSKRGWSTDVVATKALSVTTDYDLLVSLVGTTVSVQLDREAIFGHAFNAVVVDGAFGTIVHGGWASFDQVTVKTSDSRFERTASDEGSVPTATSSGSGSGTISSTSETTISSGSGSTTISSSTTTQTTTSKKGGKPGG